LVLLKNAKNVLPFQKGIRLAVIGPHGNASDVMLGNYLGQICPDNTFNCFPSLLQAITSSNKGGTTTYSQGCTVSTNSTSGFADALSKAQAADFVLLALGLDQAVESESNDRTAINLPGVQHQLAQQIIAVGKPTAIVLLNGGCVSLDEEINTAGAILEVFYPGFQGGTAVASALFGDYNPGGKLPYTVYASTYVNDIKMSDMNMTDPPGRSYKYYTGQPLWTFGWGLSYTTFKLTYNNNSDYAAPLDAVMKTGALREDGYHYEINVTNTGSVYGDEVVEAYFVPDNMTLMSKEELPIIQQLFGFERVHVAPGETVTVYFDVDSTTLKVSDRAGNLVSSPGQYWLLFTNGVSELLRARIELIGDQVVLEKFRPFT